MNKIKKSALLLLLASSFMLSGCGGNEVRESSSLEFSTAVRESTDYITPSVSKDSKNNESSYEVVKWSPDDFTTIQCCGIDISIPCKLSDIDDRFEVKISKANDEYSTSKDWIELYYENEYVGALCYTDDDYNYKTSLLKFINLEKFDFYNLSEKSSKTEVQKKLGKGTSINSDILDRYDGNNYDIIFTYEDNSTFISILSLEEE